MIKAIVTIIHKDSHFKYVAIGNSIQEIYSAAQEIAGY